MSKANSVPCQRYLSKKKKLIFSTICTIGFWKRKSLIYLWVLWRDIYSKRKIWLKCENQCNWEEKWTNRDFVDIPQRGREKWQLNFSEIQIRWEMKSLCSWSLISQKYVLREKYSVILTLILMQRNILIFLKNDLQL